MKVYLTKTPEYPPEEFEAVSNLLASFNGPIDFILSYYEYDPDDFYFLRYKLFPFHSFKYESNDKVTQFDPNRSAPLSWRELFSLGNFFREIFNVHESDFVIILTNRKNSLNWFSAYDDSRNIFVHTAEWEYFTKVNPQYPIAYKVMLNVIQVLMKMDITEVPGENIHLVPKGCMNDFCEDKHQIILKLQTANICNICIQRIKKENVKSKILQQVREVFEGIRNEFLFKVEEKPVEASSVVISPKGNVFLPEYKLEINLSPQFKTLYLFFLSKPKGIPFANLCDYNEELRKIYQKLRPSASDEDASKRVRVLTHPLGDGFNPAKSRINTIITELLGESLAGFYRISGERGEPYYVNILQEMIDNQFLDNPS